LKPADQIVHLPHVELPVNEVQGNTERRSERYAIPLDLHYKAKGVVGRGRIVNISSRGILFTTDCGLSVGAVAQIRIAWPLRLDGAVPLNLILYAVVTRSTGSYAAAKVEKYEFRTASQGVPFSASAFQGRASEKARTSKQ
jgi:hypothetical protein